MREIIRPTIEGMKEEGAPFVGFLYAGVMIDEQGNPRVLEYNVRFGDPECQPIMMRLRSDLVEHCIAALNGKLDREVAQWDPRPALGVVMASGGYPQKYDTGYVITGHGKAIKPNEKVFHDCTKLNSDGQVVTTGGRVLCPTALAHSTQRAQAMANGLCGIIHWDGVFYRKDIGHRAIAREMANA